MWRVRGGGVAGAGAMKVMLLDGGAKVQSSVAHAPAREHLPLDAGGQSLGCLRPQEQQAQHLQRAAAEEFSGDAIEHERLQQQQG